MGVEVNEFDDGSGKFQLIPIDHGLSLPDRLEIVEDDLVWMSFPQAKVPFQPAVKKWIQMLDYDKD